jgi:hypothetical protein
MRADISQDPPVTAGTRQQQGSTQRDANNANNAVTNRQRRASPPQQASRVAVPQAATGPFALFAVLCVLGVESCLLCSGANTPKGAGFRMAAQISAMTIFDAIGA